MIAHTFSLLQSVYPDFPALFTLRSKAESPLYPVLCSREVLGATSYFVLADMLDAYDPHRRAEGHGTIERASPAFLTRCRRNWEKGATGPARCCG